MADIVAYPKFQAFDSSGDPLSGGKVYTYISGTSTAKVTYTTAAASVQNANPVILDSRGEASIYLSNDAAYRFVIKDSNDVTINTIDSVIGWQNVTAGGLDLGGDLEINDYNITDNNDNEYIDFTATSTAVNNFTITNAATANRPVLGVGGDDSNVSGELKAKGTGGWVITDGNGNEVFITGAATSSAVNEITVTNAATATSPSVAATGGDTNIGIIVKGKGTGPVRLGQATSTDVRLEADQPIADSSGNELVKFTKVSSAVNEVTVSNNSTGNNPIISATGGDTNIGVDLQAKGTGAYNLKGTADQSATLRIFEDTDNGTNYIGMKVPASVTSSYDITLPVDGTNGQIIQTNGSGVWSFTSAAAGTPAGSNGQVQYNNAGAFGGDTKLTTDGAGSWAMASGGLLAFTSSKINHAKGADIASDTTTDIGGASGNVVDVTGTTTITGLGTVQAGATRIVRFTGALTLTHNATSLILPGAANITTANGDIATFVSLGSGNWYCAHYSYASSQQPKPNLLINGAFQVWQRGAGGSAAIAVAASATNYTADRWQLKTNANQTSTVTQSAGTTSGTYRARIQRNSGQTGTSAMLFATSLPRNYCENAASKIVTLSFKAAKGADYSATSSALGVKVYSGTGTTDISGINGAFTGSSAIISTTATLSTSITSYSYQSSVAGSTVTQLAVEFSFTPTGTASTNDWFEVTDVKLEISEQATPFVATPFDLEVVKCQSFYQKSSAYGTAPNNNSDADNRFTVFSTSVTNQYVYYKYDFCPRMRTAPTIVTYPYTTASNTSRFSNGSTGTDFAANSAAVHSSSHKQFLVYNNSGGALTVTNTDILGSWTADAELA